MNGPYASSVARMGIGSSYVAERITTTVAMVIT